jgi:hypothetical protein
MKKALNSQDATHPKTSPFRHVRSGQYDSRVFAAKFEGAGGKMRRGGHSNLASNLLRSDKSNMPITEVTCSATRFDEF